MPQRRAILLDASCVIRGSHNPRACRLFARTLAAQGFAPRYLIPRHGTAAFPEEEGAVERVLPYPYGPRYGIVDGSPHHPLDRRIDDLVEPHRGEARHRLANLLWRPLADGRVERLLAGALGAELDRLAPRRGELVVMPTADLYTTGALLGWLARRPPAEAPGVLLRFLSKLEAEGVHRPYGRLKALLRRAARLRQSGYPLVLAAEVEPWASRMQRRAGIPALLLPTPPEPPAPRPPGPPARLGVSLVSLRRYEQGARRLVPILQALPDALRRRCDIVGQKPWVPGTDSLAAVGVRIVADDLTEAELSATLSPLDVTLLPYLPEHYATRGSSMLFEAANHGHVVLASAGCGFSAEVESFGLGRLCAGDQDFAAALAALVDDQGLHARSQAAAERYNAYRRDCFARALDALGA